MMKGRLHTRSGLRFVVLQALALLSPLFLVSPLPQWLPSSPQNLPQEFSSCHRCEEALLLSLGRGRFVLEALG
jgi:hypothetical protein